MNIPEHKADNDAETIAHGVSFYLDDRPPSNAQTDMHARTDPQAELDNLASFGAGMDPMT